MMYAEATLGRMTAACVSSMSADASSEKSGIISAAKGTIIDSSTPR